MGLETTTYQLLTKIETAGKDCLCLGYPDLLVDPALIRGEYPELGEADQVRRWHHWDGPVYETGEVLSGELGMASVDFVDIVAARGRERIVDLNYPTDWGAGYDIVIDGGTSEHCFNIGQVFSNIVAATRPGGVVIHINPLNMMNHGFWNISPTAYHDFYTDNGFEPVYACGVAGPLRDRTVTPYTEAHMFGRFRFETPVEVTNIIAYRRTTQTQGPIIWPMQSKYR